VGVIQRIIEEAGMVTVSVSLMPFITEKVMVPRAVAVEHPFGFTLGRPGDIQTQDGILKAMLALAAEAEKPGTIKELEYKWTREPGDDPEWYSGKYFKA
jgi:hypothetical protein